MNQDHHLAQQIIQFNFLNPQLVHQALNSPHRQSGQNLCDFLCQKGYLTPEQVRQIHVSLQSSPNIQHTLISSPGHAPSPRPSSPKADDNLHAAHFDKVIERQEKLGEGGMGVVYRVIDKRLDRPAALKLLNQVHSNEMTSARFLREASITARLDHPCIPPVYEVGRTPGGELYLLMRVIEGQTLSAQIDEYHKNQRNPQALNDMLDILIKVCEAMDYAHGQRVLHRDLKPDNIMVGPFGEALVLDWGLARDMDGEQEDPGKNGPYQAPPESGATKLTQAGSLIGTLGFMPPEQAGGEEMDEGVDIFALGAVLTVILTGRRPIEGDTVMSMVTATCEGRIQSPQDILPSVPPELNSLARWALETERVDRPGTVREWLKELKAYRNQEPLSCHKYSLSDRFQRSLSRHPILVASSCALIFFLSLIAFLYSQYTLANEQKQFAEKNQELAEQQSEAAKENLERSKRVLKALSNARALVRQKASEGDICKELEVALENGERSYPLLITVSDILYQGRHWKAAEQYLKDAESSHPPAYEALFLQHQLTVEQNLRASFTPAIRRLIQSAKDKPEKNFYTLFAKALYHDQMRQDKKAEALYKELDQWSRKDATVDLFHGDFLYRQLKFEEALQLYNRSIQLSPRSAVALVRKGETLINLGRFKEAMASFNRCIEIDDKLWIPYRYKGQLLSLQNKWDTALSFYSRAIALKPNYATALASRAYAYMQLNQVEKAQQDIEKAAQIAPQDLEVIGTQASLLLAQGKADQCLKVLREGLARDAERSKRADYEFQDRATPYNLMGNVLTKKGQIDQAIEAYSQAIKANPNNTKSYASRGYCFAQQRKVDRALQDYKKAISIDPDFYQPYYNRATLKLALKKYQESLRDLNKVISLNPPILALAHAKRGEVKRELKDYQGALQDFKQALARDPNMYAVYGNRADVYVRLGDMRKAINDFETFVEYMPNHPVAKMVKKQLPRLRASLKQKETQR